MNFRILLVDVGNSSTKVALAEFGSRDRIRIVSRSSMDTSSSSAAKVGALLKQVAGKAVVRDSVLCSVVPARNAIWLKELGRIGGARPLVVGHTLELGVRIAYPRPASIGADRLANACAASALYGAPVVAVDIGTAITFDAVNARGEFIGGAIAPGPELMMRAMSRNTALLPQVSASSVRRAIGRNTVDAMKAGAMIGCGGLVCEIVRRMSAELGGRKVKLIATGGWAKEVLGSIRTQFKFDKDLTLSGLALIYSMNRNTRTGGAR